MWDSFEPWQMGGGRRPRDDRDDGWKFRELHELAGKNNECVTLRRVHIGWVFTWNGDQQMPCRNAAQAHRALDMYMGTAPENVLVHPSIEAPELEEPKRKTRESRRRRRGKRRRDEVEDDDELDDDMVREICTEALAFLRKFHGHMNVQHPDRDAVERLLEEAHEEGLL